MTAGPTPTHPQLELVAGRLGHVTYEAASVLNETALINDSLHTWRERRLRETLQRLADELADTRDQLAALATTAIPGEGDRDHADPRST